MLYSCVSVEPGPEARTARGLEEIWRMEASHRELAEPHRFLSDDELQRFERDGVVCARGLIDAATVERQRETTSV